MDVSVSSRRQPRQTIDFLLSAKRDADAAKRFFRKALAQPHTVNPRTIAAPVLSAAVAAAIGGDTRAMEIILGRVWPARRGRPVLLPDLPPIKSAADFPAAVGAIVQAVATGCLTPDEGHALGGLVEYQRRSLELVEIEARLAVLEAQSQVGRTN